MPNWTQQQQDAIADRGHSLIVCAAAGSGKTAVLVERIVQLVREGCPVDRLLVVTFTNAAAGEMRLRIGDALTKAAQEDPALAVQATALSRASISTLHRFCGSLLRENFQALGLDPAFRIGDEQECGVLSQQAMEDALYACYEVGSEEFLAADACYTQEELASIARSIYAFMMTRPDPKAWLDAAAAACSQSEEALAQSESTALLVSGAATELARLRGDAAAALDICRRSMGPAHYAEACAQDAAMIDDMLAAVQQGYNALRSAVTNVKYASLGRKKKGDVFDEALADEVKALRDRMKKRIRELEKRFAPLLADAAADLAMTRAPLNGICELVRTFELLYTAAKRRRGVLDFNDLEHEALRALTHEEVRAALAERYRYVFVDEYQDSSAIQEAILGQFAPEDGQFLVGDVKQSIYRFRQAEPALFLEKAKLYDLPEAEHARRIDLQRNFRSRANVLAGVNAVFENIMRADVTEIEYDARERLIPGLPVREDDAPLELHVIYSGYSDEEEEAEGANGEEEQEERELAAVEREALIAAQRIRALVGTVFYDAKSGTERTLAYRDVAVLMRVARGCAPLAADVLSGEGIPVFCDAGDGYFDIPEIRQMMALLSVIDNGAQDEALLAALAGPALGLSDEELARIRIKTPDTKIPYHEAVRLYREEEEDALAQKLRAFEEQLTLWRLCARHQGVDRLIERIYAQTGFPAMAGALPGGAARQANLHLLTSRARAFMRGQHGSLHAFLRYAARLRAGGDSMSASAIGESEDVVRIMTTHKSKGLEFPVVIVLGMGRSFGGQTGRARVMMHAQLGIGLPCVDTALGSERDTLLRRAIRQKLEREQLAEEIRILYVAMTRARERLILIGSTQKLQSVWQEGCTPAAIASMRTGLDMIAPVLMAAGASMSIREEEVRAGDSLWHVYAHGAEGTAQKAGRTQEDVLRLLAPLEAAKPAQAMLEMMQFDPAPGRRTTRKTSVSRVLRDEKRAAQEAGDPESGAQADRPPERLPRFMQEKQMTGAQIGTAFHRMMCMTELDALRASEDLAAELARQRERMIGDGVITAAEAQAVAPVMLRDFFASPEGVRLLASKEVRREWAFTWRRTAPDGETQLLQGVIDCCFIENGQWVLVDYKTDSAGDIPAAIERHRPQLEIYAQALEALTGRRVARRILFFVRAGAGYAV